MSVKRIQRAQIALEIHKSEVRLPAMEYNACR